jgi:hypothetical protein
VGRPKAGAIVVFWLALNAWLEHIMAAKKLTRSWLLGSGQKSKRDAYLQGSYIPKAFTATTLEMVAAWSGMATPRLTNLVFNLPELHS